MRRAGARGPADGAAVGTAAGALSAPLEHTSRVTAHGVEILPLLP